MTRSFPVRAKAGLAAAALAAPLLAASSASALSVPNLLADVDGAVRTTVGTQTVLVHAADGRVGAVTALAERAGLEIGSVFESVDVVAVRGVTAALLSLARASDVERLEADAPLQYFLDTSHGATRGQEAIDGAVGGTSYDGAGVGVAVNDSGIDGTHPALTDNMGGNVKIVPFTGISLPLPDTDNPSLGGHGTHVAGIVASHDAAQHGAAPAATLYGISSGTLISVHSAADGLEWVLDNHDQVSPAIKVVNNSWGSAAGDHNPDDLISQLNRQLTEAGVVVVYAGGNAGGDGSTQTTSPTCIDPTPGVICVASIDELGTGDRDQSVMSDFSSRGADGQVGTYPDVAAPGSNITSTCRVTLPICLTGGGLGDWATLSGTSMAAPHVAGIVAQLYQANPDLTPAQVEDILEDTAHTFGAGHVADPSNPGGTTSFEAGHGIVDVVAAIEAALNA